MVRAADVLSGSRLAAAVLLPGALVGGSMLAPALWLVACLTDLADGPVARRTSGASRVGAVLDPAADVVFVLCGLVTGAMLGLVGWLVPASVAVSATSYAVASLRMARQGASPTAARSRLGHAAGVLNYACVGTLVGTTCGMVASGWLSHAAVVTVAVNLAAVVERSARGQLAGRAT